MHVVNALRVEKKQTVAGHQRHVIHLTQPLLPSDDRKLDLDLAFQTSLINRLIAEIDCDNCRVI